MRRFLLSLLESSLGLIAPALAGGCAHMHHYEVGEIDDSKGSLRPIEVRVDETGIDAQEAAEIAKLATSSRQARQRVGTAQTVIALAQTGYKTGGVTLNDDWADGLLAAVLKRCPSGQLTGVTVIRESADYPVVSGEIVTVKGWCIQ